MKIAIYARVSTETQVKEGTIQSQIEVLRNYAIDNNHTIIQECIDNGISGADLNRPGLDQARDLSRDGLIEGILILSPDRLSRKQSHLLILLEEFKKRNVQLIFSSQSFNDSPEDNLMLQIQGAISEYERAKIIDRMRRGTIHAVKNGQVIGRNAPYGYKFIPKNDSAPGHWEIDEYEAEIVKLVFDLYVNKLLKGTQIAKFLQSEGYLSRSSSNKWWGSTIYCILKNETYLGTAYMFKNRHVKVKSSAKFKKGPYQNRFGKVKRPREEWVGIPVTQLIEKDIWEKAQELLKKNAHSSRRNNNKNQYLFRGLVICGICGSMAPRYVSNKKTYYSCGAKRNKNITSIPHDDEKVSTRHPEFDKKVWSGLVNLLNDPENIAKQIESRLEKRDQIQPIQNHELEKIDKQLIKFENQEKRIIDAYRENVITLDELRDQKDKIWKRVNSLNTHKNSILNQIEAPKKPEISLEMLGDISARFKRAMDNADFSTKEKLANLLLNKIALYPEKTIVHGNIPITNSDVLKEAGFRQPFFVLEECYYCFY